MLSITSISNKRRKVDLKTECQLKVPICNNTRHTFRFKLSTAVSERVRGEGVMVRDTKLSSWNQTKRPMMCEKKKNFLY